MWTWPVVIIVSTATRLRGSWASMASRIESLIWSAILSGWPSVTDSDVKRRRVMSVLLGRWARVVEPFGPRLGGERYPPETAGRPGAGGTGDGEACGRARWDA